MLKIQEHISQIDSRLQQLLKQYENLKTAYAKKEEQVTHLSHQLHSCNEKLEKAEQENLVLKASITQMDPADKKLFDQKIQHYIKNIDTCISLLSQ